MLFEHPATSRRAEAVWGGHSAVITGVRADAALAIARAIWKRFSMRWLAWRDERYAQAEEDYQAAQSRNHRLDS